MSVIILLLRRYELWQCISNVLCKYYYIRSLQHAYEMHITTPIWQLRKPRLRDTPCQRWQMDKWQSQDFNLIVKNSGSFHLSILTATANCLIPSWPQDVWAGVFQYLKSRREKEGTSLSLSNPNSQVTNTGSLPPFYNSFERKKSRKRHS